jgi:hypothetical protein
MNRDLNALDPLPKLGAKVQTEVVYYHQEEKEIKPNLYEKDGKLRYAPPLEWTEKDLMDALQACWNEAAPEEFMVTHMHVSEAAWKALGAVEEEKQDNKLDVSHGHAYFTDSAGNDIARPIDAEGWISHTPGDPMPCESGLLVCVRFKDDNDPYMEGLPTRAGYWSDETGRDEDCWTGVDTENKIVAWKPA